VATISPIVARSGQFFLVAKVARAQQFYVHLSTTMSQVLSNIVTECLQLCRSVDSCQVEKHVLHTYLGIF